MANLFIIKAILNPFSATFHVQGIFQPHFQYKKVHTILNKMRHTAVKFFVFEAKLTSLKLKNLSKTNFNFPLLKVVIPL